MRATRKCPKCGSKEVVRVPDNPWRHASGNNIYITRLTLAKKIPVIRYVCCYCGYVEDWVETVAQREEIQREFGG